MVVLSEITILSPSIAFLIITPFLIIQFFPMLTPLPITQLLNIFVELSIVAYFEI